MDREGIDKLAAIVGKENVKDSGIWRGVYGRDASYYGIEPECVVRPRSAEEVEKIIKYASDSGKHITFRSGGTSLCGQALGTGIVCEVRGYMRRAEVRDNGRRIWFEPGLTVNEVNRYLKSHHAKIGPDPASSSAAMMGGVLANNSSGMEAGVRFNSYHTLSSIEFILPNGHRYDTSTEADRKRFEADEHELCEGLMQIRREILDDPDTFQRIKRKYEIKNVTGYAMNSFIDYDTPLDIFSHLLIGSEGTLGYIVSGELHTQPLYDVYSSTMLYFSDVTKAAAQADFLGESGALAVEMMDTMSLRASLPGLHIPDSATALLVDYGAGTSEELEQRIASLRLRLAQLPGITHIDDFTRTVADRARLWRIRDGVFPCVAGARVPGNAVILEDVVAPVARLDNLVDGVQQVFAKYGYQGAIFGHARDGNIHPLVTPDIDHPQAMDVFRGFMEDLVDTVLRLDGSLKGEHGTGRAMAPFVSREWGEKIYGMMKRVKRLADPQGIMNPGVVINDDPLAHIHPMKSHALFSGEKGYAEGDRCMECGYCEHVCPTRYATFTPRQRIQAWRIIKERPELAKENEYPNHDTCCTDGSCLTPCPMHINTAIITDGARRDSNSRIMDRALQSGASHYGAVETSIRDILKMAVASEKVLSPYPLIWASDVLHRMSRLVPHFSKDFPMPARIHYVERDDAEWVYFPACVTRIFGGSSLGKDDLITVILRLADRAGLRLSLPKDMHGVCCSQIWEHTGNPEGQRITANAAVEEFWKASGEGRIPILCDTTSCTHTLLNLEHAKVLTPENEERYRKLRIVDICEWLCDVVLKRVDVVNRKKHVLLHPTCASRLTGHDRYLERIAAACAEEYTVPYLSTCCGAAGDRGFIYPEVARKAVRDEKAEIGDKQYDGYYSLARTCEISMMDTIGRPYESIVYLVDETTA